MGRPAIRKVAITICLLILTGIAVHWPRPSTTLEKTLTLDRALMDLEKWQKSGYVPLDEKIVDFLNLDDYTYQDFSNGSKTVFLYIGYYFSSQKVGAAHDPLVCYPGQGWTLSDRKTGFFQMESGKADPISYSSMIAENGSRKELIVYWFQSFDRTSPDTFSQKLALLWSKFSKGREDNALIRISTPIEKDSAAAGYETIRSFISEFYPVFLTYVKN
jgi:EpsI family protein